MAAIQGPNPLPRHQRIAASQAPPTPARINPAAGWPCCFGERLQSDPLFPVMSRATPETANAQRVFVERAMATIRQRLYPHVSDSVFEREWRDLLFAISEPANYFKMRGWNGSGGLYLRILRKAIDDLT